MRLVVFTRNFILVSVAIASFIANCSGETRDNDSKSPRANPFTEDLARRDKADTSYINPDGIEVTACGNGARCIAYLVSQENKEKKILIKTKERVLRAEIIGKQSVRINMGEPKFGWEEVPLSEEMNTKRIGIESLEKEHG